MLVVTFAASGEGNCVVVGGRPYVLARTKVGSYLLRATCPHRGGPLHLADLDAAGTALVCPWHEQRYPFQRSREAAIPLVRSANRVTAVFPADEEYVREYRPVARCLGGQHASSPHARLDRERGHDRPPGHGQRPGARAREAGPGRMHGAAARSAP